MTELETDPGFPGLCDRCGGPQQWTMAEGVTWVRCLVDLCAEQLEFPGIAHPIVKVGEEFADRHWNNAE